MPRMNGYGGGFGSLSVQSAEGMRSQSYFMYEREAEDRRYAKNAALGMAEDKRTLEGIRRGELTLSPQAQFILDRLDDMDVKAANDATLDGRQLDDVLRQSEERRRAILRTARPKRQTEPTLDEGWQQDTKVVDDGNGQYRVQRVRGKDGSVEWKAIRGAPVAKPDGGADAMKLKQAYVMQLLKLANDKGPLYTPETAWAEADKRYGKAAGGDAVTPSEAAPTPGQAGGGGPNISIIPPPGSSGGAVAPTPASAPSAMPTPKSKAEFDALPSGTVFVAPDGTTRRKP